MIALITPTGARPKQIQLCVDFMKHQDYEGDVLWVIVDDGNPASTEFIPEDFRKGWKIIKVYPKAKWRSGAITQCSNILEGLKVVKQYDNIDLVFIIEDDDYYTPRYLRVMLSKLNSYLVIGEQYSIYYNPVLRGYFLNGNTIHSSLFQTAFSPLLLEKMEGICTKKARFIDMTLFKRSNIPFEKMGLFSGENLAIGIKGLPGRGGIGMGHRPGLQLVPDPDMSKLKEWIGDDFIYYMNYKS
jgi:hypothetical protein